MFTGDQFGEGANDILEILKANGVKASFFLTGNFYSNPRFASIISAIKMGGHYLGAHSDKHLLYADWEKRDSLLVTRKEFISDLNENYRRMGAFGIKKKDARFFLPPYEWYNSTVARWTKEMNLQLVNFSPGTRSAADYTYPGMKSYLSSDKIYQSIINYERTDPHGLNGFILLLHIGTDQRRTDKFYHRLDGLIKQLKDNEYNLVRIDRLLKN